MILIVKKQEDTRYAPNIRHKMEDIILIVLFAILAKCNEWTEIESFAKKKEKWLKNIWNFQMEFHHMILYKSNFFIRP